MNSDILQIDGKSYALTEIQGAVDVRKELEEIYESKIDGYKKEFGEGLVIESFSDWEKQVAKISALRNKHVITVPKELYGKSIMVHKESLMATRIIRYAPHEIRGSRHTFSDLEASRSFSTIHQQMLESIDAVASRDYSGTIVISVEPKFNVLQVLAYDATVDTMYTPFFRSFHAYGDSRICTGENSAKAFWSLNNRDFEYEMNKINLYSPATQTITIEGNDVRILELLERCNIKKIQKLEDSEWSV